MLDQSRLSPHTSYLLAISGGRDSVSLLHQLLSHGFRDLHLVHLDHQLRGQESEGDSLFVKQLAQDHDLPLTLQKTDVAARAKEEGLSLETAARNARHQLFAETARSTGCNRILLAHHAEDQAETCLFNLLRGSAGLKGMQLESEFLVDQEKLIFLRPLLHTRRAQIDRYLAEQNIAYREDPSNQDPCHTRNRLRNEALPLLSEIMQRDIVPSLTRAVDTSQQNDLIPSQLLDSLQLRDPQGRLFLPKLRELPDSLQKACLKQYLQEHQVPQISKPLLESALKVIPSSGPPALNLPGNRFLRRKEGRILVI